MLLKDLLNMFKVGLSVKPQTTSGTTAIPGDTVDMDGTIGPFVVEVTNGSATGSPTAQAHAVKVQQGALANGSDAADITGATATISADKAVTRIHVHNRTGRYVRIHVTPAWTGGTSPTTQVAGTVKAQKDSF